MTVRKATRRGGKSSTRERVLDAALELFGSQGFAATTTKEIAKRAGVNEVTLFRIFGSKQGLYASMFAERSLIPSIMGSVEFDDDVPLEEMMMRNASAVLSILKENRHIFMVMLSDVWKQPKARRTFGEVPMQTAIRFLSSMFERQMEMGRMDRMDPEIAARAMIGMVQAYFLTTYLMQGSADDPQRDEMILRGFVSIFLTGVLPERRRGGS